MAAEFVQDYQTFDLGDFTLQHGDTLKDAKLAYKTFGELNADKSNAIVYPTWYSGFHWDNEWLVGEDMALDPRKVAIQQGAAAGGSQAPAVNSWVRTS